MTQPTNALPDNATILVPTGSFADLAEAIFAALGPIETLKTMIDERVRATALLQWARRQHGSTTPRDEWIAVIELIIGSVALCGFPPSAEDCF